MFYVISHERSGTHRTINNIVKNAVVGQELTLGNVGEWWGPYTDQVDRAHRIYAMNVTHSGRHCMVKSHCDRPLWDQYCRPANVVYVMRDPRDTMVSWWHYLNHGEYYAANPRCSNERCETIGEFIRRPCSDFMRLCYSLDGRHANVVERWAHHVRGWTGHSQQLVHVVKFSEWDRSFRGTINRLMCFLGLERVRQPAPVGLWEMPSILPREGKVGDWRKWLTDEDEQFIHETVVKAGLRWSQVTALPDDGG